MKPPLLRDLPPPPPGKTGWPWTEGSVEWPDRAPYGKDWPKISIVTPSYNQSEYLEGTIRSVLLQGYPNMEYIIIDGGSDDGSNEILKKYGRWLKYWTSRPDNGIYDAMNKGVEIATGSWILFLGADDIMLPVLSKVVPLLKNSKHIYYGDVLFKNKGTVYDGKFNAAKLSEMNICQQAIFYPLKVFEKYQFNLKYPIMADWDLNLRCWGSFKFQFSYLPILIAIYNDHGASSKVIDKNFSDDGPEIAKKYLGCRILISRLANKVSKLVLYFKTIILIFNVHNG